MKNKKYKCLSLMSGGLDSMLAAKILKEAGIEVTPLCFKSFFFSSKAAEKAAKQIGLKLKVVDFSKEHLKIIKSPKHGRGSGFNPCIDCHLLMIKTAGKIMRKEGYDFVATGEVLGQRPMSQNINSLNLIEKESGLKGLIIRPLSVKVLPKTIPEKLGMIKRDSFYDISGRGRGRQIELAKKFKIEEYPSPAGGCILTDPNYSKKLFELFRKVPRFDGSDAQLITLGRVFWEKDLLVIVARDEKECKELAKVRKRGDVVLEPQNYSGPTVLVRKYKKSPQEEMIDCGIDYSYQYSKNVPDDFVLKLLPFPKP